MSATRRAAKSPQASLGIVRTTREYDAQGGRPGSPRPSRRLAGARVRYGYDLRGRVTSVTETRTGGKPTRRPMPTTASGGSPRSRRRDPVERDGYDAAGNRVAVETPSRNARGDVRRARPASGVGTAKYTFRPDGQLASVTDGGRHDRLRLRRLRGAPGGHAARRAPIDYLVDAGGARIGKKVDGTLVAGYLYGPDGPLAAQTDGSGAVVARFGYDDAGRLVLVERGNTRYQVVTDHLGSPLLVIDAASGAVAEAITYDAWGNVTSDTNPGFMPIGFAGGLRDADTGLVKFGAREYDPGPVAGPGPIRSGTRAATRSSTAMSPAIRSTGPTRAASRRPVTRGLGDPGHSLPPTGTATAAHAATRTSAYRHCGHPLAESRPAGQRPARDPHGPLDVAASKGLTCLGRPRTGTHSQTRRRRPASCRASAGHLQRRRRCARAIDLCRRLLRTRRPPRADRRRGPVRLPGGRRVPDGRLAGQERGHPGSPGAVRLTTIATLGTAVAASVAGDRVAVYANDKMPLTIDGQGGDPVRVLRAPAARRDRRAARLARDDRLARRQPARRLARRQVARLLLRSGRRHRADAERAARQRRRQPRQRLHRPRRHRARPGGPGVRHEALRPVRGELADQAGGVAVRLRARREHGHLHQAGHPARAGHHRLVRCRDTQRAPRACAGRWA